MKASQRSLQNAMRNRWLVRFSRRFEPGSVRGYVLDIGPEFFLLALVSDRIWFDGFECFRAKDVLDVRRDPYADFAEAALKLRHEQIPKIPPIELDSAKQLLLSANRAFPLVAIHREESDPHVCHIGHVLAVNRGIVTLQEICPDATWEDTPRSYPLNEITRIGFGADYEDALHLVGGTFDRH
jgi:hypothetical protein